MEGAFTSLKMQMHSSIFSGLTWTVTTRASIALFLLLYCSATPAGLSYFDYIPGPGGPEGELL
jgi:hypothetical protein